MASKEVYVPEQKKGAVDNGLNTWQKFNKVTLAAGLGAGAVGLAVGMPWLATVGFTSAAIDGAQIVGINEIQKRRARKRQEYAMSQSLMERQRKEQPIVRMPKSATIFEGRRAR